MVVRALIFLLGSVCACTSVWAADASLEARVDRNVVSEGETLVLELVQRGTDSEPDASPLLLNFEVLSTGRSSQMSIVNGSVDSYTIWRYTLSPLRSGTLVIPAISSGAVRSDPVSVRVKAAGASSDGQQPRDIFIEANVDETDPYVQAQVMYTVKIFRSRDFYDGSLSEPKSDDLILQRLGEDTSYKLQRDGIRYTIIQRRYVLFPQKSGEVRVPPVVLGATVPTTSASHGSFGGLLAQKRPIRVRSDEIVLNVQAAPPGFSGQWWLPARSLSLKEEWPGSGGEFRVGNPITRAVVLESEGVLRGQLPRLSIPDIAGLKIYSDQPELDENITLDGLIGKHTERWALIPSRPGRFVLPELRVAWWDVIADKEQIAVLPSRAIDVLPALSESLSSSTSVTSTASSASDSLDTTQVATHFEEASVSSDESHTVYWLSAVGFLLLAWLFTTALLLRKLRYLSSSANSARNVRNTREAIKGVKVAYSANDKNALKTALLRWAGIVWPDQPTLNLVEVASRVEDSELSTAVLAIDESNYAENSQSTVLNIDNFISMLRRAERRASAENKVADEPLPQF